MLSPLTVGTMGTSVARLQALLRSRGFETGSSDGLLSSRTMAALQRAFNDLAGSSDVRVRQAVAGALVSTSGTTVEQTLALLSGAFALDDRATGRLPGGVPPPEEPVREIRMTPADAVRTDKRFGLAGHLLREIEPR